MLPQSLDDVDAILVYADELMSRGHPHGNLIALQHGKKTKQATSWLRKHASEILGRLEVDGELIEVKWENGFIRSACLNTGYDESEDESLSSHYDRLRASPAGKLIRQLSLGQAGPERTCTSEHSYCYEPLFARIAKHPLRTLRVLDVGGEVVKQEFNCARGLDRVLAKHSGLEELAIHGGAYAFGAPTLPNLRSLRISADHTASTIRDLARADLPVLAELDLHGGAGSIELHAPRPTAADYEALFAGDRMPKLRRVALDACDVATCRALFRSPLLRRLDELTLDFIDGAIADLVLAAPAPLKHLKKLALTTLRPGDVSASQRKQLKSALPRLH